MKVKSIQTDGFTLVEIMIVVALIGLLSAVAVPNFAKARTLSHRNVCISNLKQIDDAKVAWAMDNNKSTTETPAGSDIFGPESYLPRMPVCPSSGTYTIGKVGLRPTCTFEYVEGHSL